MLRGAVGVLLGGGYALRIGNALSATDRYFQKGRLVKL